MLWSQKVALYSSHNQCFEIPLCKCAIKHHTVAGCDKVTQPGQFVLYHIIVAELELSFHKINTLKGLIMQADAVVCVEVVTLVCHVFMIELPVFTLPVFVSRLPSLPLHCLSISSFSPLMPSLIF